MNYQQLLEQAQDYVLNFYKTHDTSKLLYHNLNHTQDVVAAAIQIANHYQLSDDDFFIVLGAVWFHDLGYMVDVANHEEKGADLAVAFFGERGVDKKHIDLMVNCILATKMPQSPKTLLEEIVCDADVFHLGTDDFKEKDKLLLKEINLLYDANLSKQQWREKSIKFLEGQSFHTDYCKLLLNDTKEKNLEKLKNKWEEEEADQQKKVEKDQEKAAKKLHKEEKLQFDATIITEKEPSLAPVSDSDDKKKKIKEKDKPEKGIETMFRISSSNHQRLSDMADNKAHIMITVNSIILSAVLSLLLRRLSEYGYLVIPTFILLTVSLLAMTFSILSTRPSIPAGNFTREDVNNRRVNLLFFGNFYKATLDEYNYGMQKMMIDKDFLYGSLIRDVYAQGVVLGRKYRLLRIAYNIFMFGLIVSVIAFIIAAAFYGKVPTTIPAR
ncbi:phosphohydrolase [Mucilaginibacter sp. BJC16-A38]|uniref:Pycsar system effector family protein n=1 Tax=Mucilaginibacter phenanthrenivorans TaxID=1234842 RepID=UPI0021577FB7|nr:Pycsar system effector family protein [Mucilaginibacter phenanthrenivorans]MCR8561152.1 phosphohydrolase [Mucilaginibacter phenanthrenivorans]